MDSSDYEDCQDYNNTVNRKNKKAKHKSRLSLPKTPRKINPRLTKQKRNNFNKSNSISRESDNEAEPNKNKPIKLRSHKNLKEKEKMVSPLVDSNKVKYSTEQDQDNLERQDYIDILTKLISLNMPSHIESSRSNEAFRTRNLFFINRRTTLGLPDSENMNINSNVNSNNNCQLHQSVLSTEKFWMELQHYVCGRDNKRIHNKRSQIFAILTACIDFKIDSTDEVFQNTNLPYTLNYFYLQSIETSHRHVTQILSKYQKLLSYWPTSAQMYKCIKKDHNYNMTIFNGNVNTMQAWLTCCEWLNWKTTQLCEMIDIPAKQLHLFAIRHLCDLRICQRHQNEKQHNFTSFAFDSLPDTADVIKPVSKKPFRRFSLCSYEGESLPDPDISEGENDSTSALDCDELFNAKLDTYADISRRRYGLDKLSKSSIETVEGLLKKFQNILSITKEENAMPLIHSFADIVKKESRTDMSQSMYLHNPIFSEDHVSEVSCSSYKTPNQMDEEDFPCFPHGNNLVHSTSVSRNASPSIYEDFDPNCTYSDDDCISNGVEIDVDNYQLLSTLRGFQSLHPFPSTNNNNNVIVDVSGVAQRNYGYIHGDDIKGLLGLRNETASRLNLPPLLPHYLFLARFPVRIMHSVIRRVLAETSKNDITNLQPITIKRKINDFKDILKFTMRARQFLCDVTYGINFQIQRFEATKCRNFAPQQEMDQADFIRTSMKEVDADLSNLLKLYMEFLKELLNIWYNQSATNKLVREEPRRLLEEEWKFVKTFCHSIRQDEEILASSFCKLAEYLFELLKMEIEEEHKLILEIEHSPNDSPEANSDNCGISSSSFNRKMSNSCHSYKKKCRILQSRLKQATEFTKLLRADLEISLQLELTSSYSINDFLSYLQKSRHKLIDLSSVDETSLNNHSELNLIIPEESSTYLNELLHPLITGFSQPLKDDELSNTSNSIMNSSSSKSGCGSRKHAREYILVISKKSKINWEGDKISHPCSLDINNLKQRLESSNILFIARRPDELTEQYQHLLSQTHNNKAPLSKIIHCCCVDTNNPQAEACHYNTKRNLNSLKSKVVEVAEVLQNEFVTHEPNLAEFDRPLNQNQEITVKNTVKYSYSIAFEFYRDLIRICTGDAFTNSLKNTVIGLAEKWFTFSKDLEPSENGTVPRWANDGLNFVLQVLQSRVVGNMTGKEWQDFKQKIDKFIEFIVGNGSRRHNSACSGRSTGSSRIISGRSWLNQPQQPDVIKGCENDISNVSKINQWKTNVEDNRQLRMAFSQPNEVDSLLDRQKENRKSGHINSESGHINSEIYTSPTSSISVDQATLSITSIQTNTNTVINNNDHHSNKSTDGSSDSESSCTYHHHRGRKNNRIKIEHSIRELEKKLDQCSKENCLIGRIRDCPTNDDRQNFIIKKAPFTWGQKEFIGQGSSGKVFKVCNMDDMKPMAMKEIVLNEPFNHDPAEYDLLCSLRDANLLVYYGVDISISHLRIFTEFCDSGTLAMVSVAEIPEITLRCWTSQVLSALVFMHDHKIVHRDVKPENIFLINFININDKGCCNAKLGDFGSAKRLNLEFGLKDVIGTFMYMAPEITVVDSKDNKSGMGYNQKVDIWSLGCVVLFMMTGRPPWSETENFKIYYNLGVGRRPHIPDVNEKKMSSEAYQFINRCLNVDPKERPDAIDLRDMDFVHLSPNSPN